MIAMVLLSLLIFFKYVSFSTKEIKMELNIINTEVGAPDSFDPISADKTQNITAMRLLYSTPLAIDKNNEIYSTILSSFSFDRKSNTANLILKSNLYFSNGKPLTARDLALSISRFGYFHPEFPVIHKIVGLSDWANKKEGLRKLPSGIQIIDNEVKIHFEGNLANPLFRFCLEIFSIIPEASVDLETGKLIDELPPFSGFYELENKIGKEWSFLKRTNKSGLDNTEVSYNKISLIFKSMTEACASPVAENTVVAGFEMDFLMSDCLKQASTDSMRWLPAARFGLLRFNPNHELFRTKNNRQLFAELVRLKLKEKYTDLRVERSLFTRLLPGYLSTLSSINTDRLFFKNKILLLPKNSGSAALIYQVLITVAEDLQMKVEFIDKELTQKDTVDHFVSGKLPVIFGGSGFWAQDPVGDLQMYFTKNFHKTMTFVWADDGIYSRLQKLDSSADPDTIRELMEDFNKYIFDQSLIAPIVHFRRFFKTAEKQKLDDLPQAVTSPSPWQLKLINK
jgi:ABC-type transport system substrate-binding protein